MELHRKMKHNEKVCHTEQLRPYAQGQGHSRIQVKFCLKLCLSINL